MGNSFFSDLLQTIAERGRALLPNKTARRIAAGTRSEDFVELCEELLSGRGEASGVALARHILDRYAELTTGPRVAFFEALAQRFGTDPAALQTAIAAWQENPCDAAASQLHVAAEPRRQELFRRLNLAPGGTAALVRMREDLLDAMEHRPDLASVDADFVHLFSSWFNRGFLVLRQIDWSTPANILEKIIRHEAVHEIESWDDLRRRIDPADRRCYAFFHPALVDEPLIFVEVAFARGMPGAIAPILAADRDGLDPAEAETAVFYSISNCQRGLAGVSFGNFLIKQVVDEISHTNPKLSRFVTLSPVPGFAAWLRRECANETSQILPQDLRGELTALDGGGQAEALAKTEEPLREAAACYLLHGRNRHGLPLDPVARFHLGNGARLEQIHALADLSDKGLRQSFGVMVNYLYDLADIEKNHELYAESRVIAASGAVRKLAPAMAGEVVPLTGESHA